LGSFTNLPLQSLGANSIFNIDRLKRKTFDGWEPIHQKYKANENTSRHNQRENKIKQPIKSRWRPYAKKTHGNKMIINDNKGNLRWKNCVVCYKLVSNGGALVMVCGRDEEPWPKRFLHLSQGPFNG
jgi:hypothetical protein